MTSRIVLRAVLVLGASALLLASPRAIAQSPAPDARERQIFVTVLDKSGAPVKNLSAGDFVVRENKTVRKVTAVAPATDKLWLSLLVDTTKEPKEKDPATQDLRKALGSFVSAVRSASGDAEISLAECAGAVMTDVGFTTETDPLRVAIQHLTSGPRAGAVLLEALLDSSKRLGLVSSPRRMIVSVDFDDSSEASGVLPQLVIDRVRASGASLWALSIQRSGNVGAASMVDAAMFGLPGPRREVLSELPRLTGGEHLHAIGTTSLAAMLDRIADALTHQYLVTYIRSDTAAVSSVTATSPRGETTLVAPWVR